MRALVLMLLISPIGTVAALAGDGQSANSTGSTTSTEHAGGTPLFDIALADRHANSVTVPSDIFEGPVRCTSDGAIFLNSFVPPKFETHFLSSVAIDGATQAFELSRISDLYDIRGNEAIDWAASAKGVTFLVYATKDSDRTLKSTRDPRSGESSEKTGYWGEHGLFLASFDRTGAYQGSARIDVPNLDFTRIAAFDSGDLLILGLDRANHVPKIALARPDGTVTRYLDPGAELPTDSDMFHTEGNEQAKDDKPHKEEMQLLNKLALYNMLSDGDTILLTEPGSTGPVFQVRASGSVRVIPVQLPSGYVIDSALPSDAGVFVKLRRKGTNNGKAPDSMIVQVDPNSGAPLKQIRMRDVSIYSVDCVHDGIYRVMRQDNETHMRIIPGELAPARDAAAHTP